MYEYNNQFKRVMLDCFSYTGVSLSNQWEMSRELPIPLLGKSVRLPWVFGSCPLSGQPFSLGGNKEG